MAANRTDHHCGATVDEGAVTAEYVVGTVAAAGFAAVLIGLLKSPFMHGVLGMVIRKALGIDWW